MHQQMTGLNLMVKRSSQQFKLAFPIVAQAFVGLGSWVVFFGIVENMGERPLAVTNLARIVYLVLSIPTWGFTTGVNTLVSSFIGQRRRDLVIPIISLALTNLVDLNLLENLKSR